MQHSTAVATPRTREADAYRHLYASICLNTVLQRPRSAAFLTRLLISHASNRVRNEPSAAAATPRTRESDAYRHLYASICLNAVLQRPRRAAFLRGLVASIATNPLRNAALCDAYNTANPQIICILMHICKSDANLMQVTAIGTKISAVAHSLDARQPCAG